MKLVLGALLLAVASASAQVAACPKAEEVAQAQLLGTWQAKFEGDAPFAITLGKHPEFAETVRGFIERDGRRVSVAGDVDEGQLTLEESNDGLHISAVWLGDVVEGSCGREIHGTWKAEGTTAERPFVMTKP